MLGKNVEYNVLFIITPCDMALKCNLINFISCNKMKNRFCTHKKFENLTISQNFEHIKEQF